MGIESKRPRTRLRARTPFARPRVLVVGSSNTDMIIRVARLPGAGETVLGGEFLSVPGGKGANQAVAAARAGAVVTFIARVGRDAFGATALRNFQADHLDTRYLVRDPARPSGVALICVAKNGENCIAVAPGANAELAPADLRRAARSFRAAPVMLVQLESPLRTVAAALELAAANCCRVILNPAPAQALPARWWPRLYVITPNETEAAVLTGVPVRGPAGAARAAAVLLARGVPNVIITLGARGAYVANAEGRELVPGHRVKAVDTTGAGDVFNGALAVALAEGQALLPAARLAGAAAALSVTRPGAQASAPTRVEIQQFLSRRAAPA